MLKGPAGVMSVGPGPVTNGAASYNSSVITVLLQTQRVVSVNTVATVTGSAALEANSANLTVSFR